MAMLQVPQPCLSHRKCTLPSGWSVYYEGLSFTVKEEERRYNHYPYLAATDIIYCSCFVHQGDPDPSLGHPGDVYVDVEHDRLWAKVGEQEWQQWTSMGINSRDEGVVYHPCFPKRRILFVHPKDGRAVWTLCDTARRWMCRNPGFEYGTALRKLVEQYRPRLQGQHLIPVEFQTGTVEQQPAPVHGTSAQFHHSHTRAHLSLSPKAPSGRRMSFHCPRPLPPTPLCGVPCDDDATTPSEVPTATPIAKSRVISPIHVHYSHARLSLDGAPTTSESYLERILSYPTSAKATALIYVDEDHPDSTEMVESTESSEDEGSPTAGRFELSYCRLEPYPKRENV
ncbi:hypothetical protein NEOLEDRAFT_1152457 [Neolentinus lepideus HHB14362 ss-1]|uniref:Uncharacterized protein n=1 Tax=Neolentinus lepideus HHB14362 ss-1 TaxID=1314782 RepID=A0A165MRX6_9AGAM|nr:hypothetical protein NEOLEDRAFT_1152457 [Neolentinus lepideus HHB14362 ss-1]